VLLLRAWRTTQPRLAIAEPVLQDQLFTHRRISAAFKDIPGGQLLGPSLDYSHRLLATDVLQGQPLHPVAVEPALHPAPARPALAGNMDKRRKVWLPIRRAPRLRRTPFLILPANRCCFPPRAPTACKAWPAPTPAGC